MPGHPSLDYLDAAKRVISLEIQELSSLQARLGPAFVGAVDSFRAVLENGRKLLVCGVGKSGNIAAKIAATLTSTGATAVVLNSQDALHGDLGLVNAGDGLLLLSASGETDELLNLLPHLQRMDVTLVAMTGGLDSTLARTADIVLDVSVEREACPLNLAPTSSSTVMLVLGDALAMVLLEARGFQAEDFAKFHPGGSLGRALLTKVSSVMRGLDRVALVRGETPVLGALEAMTSARAGAAVVVDADGRLQGIFTQGDFVRAFQKHREVGSLAVDGLMCRTPVTVQAEQLAAHVLGILEKHVVDELVVLDAENRPVGIVDTQDLSRLKLV
jgi:arabinose-5-phosphate isomerase